MSILARLFGETKEREPLEPLWRSIVAAARAPFWYREGGVPDTIDGRFDMVAALTSLVLIRLERDGEAGRRPAVLLTELFVADMDESLRQIGIGDYVVGKHVGKMVGALGGRLGALREAIEAGSGFAGPVRRNVFRESPPSEDAVAVVAERLERFFVGLEGLSTPDLLKGTLPTP